MYLQKIIVCFLLLLGILLPLSSFAYSTVDQMNKQGKSTKVVREYVGQWKGWAHHDMLLNKATKKKSFSRKKTRPASNYSKLIRDAARKLKVGQSKVKKAKLVKPKILIATSAKVLKSKKNAIANNDNSDKITTDSLRYFAKLLNIGEIKKKTFRKKVSRKLVVYKPRKSKYIKAKISEPAPEVKKERIIIKSSKLNSEQKVSADKEANNDMAEPKNWSTVNQSLPLLMKALSD